jgi:hypothetical protein
MFESPLNWFNVLRAIIILEKSALGIAELCDIFLADLVANFADLFALKQPIRKPSASVCRYADATLDMADWRIGRFSADQNRHFYN